ncbi:MAG: hypothetical protein L0Y72_13045 [Gemmataceae bacterium]|nr:hypothetical protein [Gemmataceae bacterium]MCI0739964.1 hypothetical protein [Gemmataceae bacterium]
MRIIPIEKLKITLPEAARMAKSGPVILTHKGKPLAAINDLSDCDWESISLANNPRFRAIIEESRRSYRKEGGIAIEDLRKELGLTSKANGKRVRGKKRGASASKASK